VCVTVCDREGGNIWSVRMYARVKKILSSVTPTSITNFGRRRNLHSPNHEEYLDTSDVPVAERDSNREEQTNISIQHGLNCRWTVSSAP